MKEKIRNLKKKNRIRLKERKKYDGLSFYFPDKGMLFFFFFFLFWKENNRNPTPKTG
jgi:hypothetical protein